MIELKIQFSKEKQNDFPIIIIFSGHLLNGLMEMSDQKMAL